uniref:Uncharacterized protein n=1 Tax=Globisporangium ultimum (strain ATCC 200006 / CBS 805.95 / DAOM BR144) TaxID=431595 RepID=K3WEE8_GLOUD
RLTVCHTDQLRGDFGRKRVATALSLIFRRAQKVV